MVKWLSRKRFIVTVYGSEVQGSGFSLRPIGGLRFFHIFAFNLSANCWLSNFLENGYYSYHYSYLTTQLFDDLTTSEVNISCEICICQIFSGSVATPHKRWFEGMTQKDIAGIIGKSQGRVSQIKRDAKKAGLLDENL